MEHYDAEIGSNLSIANSIWFIF